jgi:hypothetical protein
MPTTEERLREMGLLGRFREIQQMTPEERRKLEQVPPPINEPQGGDLKIPVETGEDLLVGTSQAKSRLEFYREQQKIQTQTMADIEKRLEEEQKARKEREKTFAEKHPILDKYITDKDKIPSIEERRAEEFEKLGVKPKEFFAEQAAAVAEIGSLMEDYDKAVAMRDATVARMEERPGVDLGFQQREVAQIKKRHNIELSQKSAAIKTKMAIQEMKNGNFEQARNFVREAVNDWTFDLQLELKQWERFEEQNADIIEGLEDEYKTALKESKAAKLKELELMDKEQEKVGNLMLDYPTANIQIGDTLAEAQEKASRIAGVPTEEVGDVMNLDVIRAEIREDIRALKAENPNITNSELYERIADGITTSNIANKQAAYNEARKLLGIATETPTPAPTPVAPAPKFKLEPGQPLFKLPDQTGAATYSFWGDVFGF